ncbi:hypothetical protein RhiirA4_527799 [Rhizophagus irregularis]|uniref:Crinkler effector protein N-terminal domain-containing protein n=1 Tax=Rhizophagus irregularis TaxID=588596 RepID=A0A2I1GSC3_9GLOM|nr:hypothetical protein RhiirA4_527799 [Rhizophagus irregularis]
MAELCCEIIQNIFTEFDLKELSCNRNMELVKKLNDKQEKEQMESLSLDKTKKTRKHTAIAFPVRVDKTSLLGELKKAIKAENSQTFANVDAKDIKLWKVEIPDNHDDQLSNLTLQDQPELLATREI